MTDINNCFIAAVFNTPVEAEEINVIFVDGTEAVFYIYMLPDLQDDNAVKEIYSLETGEIYFTRE